MALLTWSATLSMIWQSLWFFYWPYLLSISIFNMFQPTQVFSYTRWKIVIGDPLENSKRGRWFNISDVHISIHFYDTTNVEHMIYICIYIYILIYDISWYFNLSELMKLYEMNYEHDFSWYFWCSHFNLCQTDYLGMIISISKHSHL